MGTNNKVGIVAELVRALSEEDSSMPVLVQDTRSGEVFTVTGVCEIDGEVMLEVNLDQDQPE